jgi:hypothetical protein
MSIDAPPLRSEHAEAWRRGYVPWWVPRAVLTVGWVTAFVASVVLAASDDAPCTPTDPDFCGPDTAFAWTAIVLFATPALLWWRPLVGCAAGITFALLELAFSDDSAAVDVLWALHGGACLVVAAWLVWCRWRQRAGVGSLVPHQVTPPPVARSAESGIPVAALVCALAAAGVTYYAWDQFASDDSHRQAAVRVDGRVSAVDEEDYTITVRVPSGGEHTFDVFETETYPVRSTTPVLVDLDSDWAELVAEPHDRTMWITGAGLAWVAAAALGCRHVRRRWAVSRLTSGPQLALRVRVRSVEHEGALLYAADDLRGRRPIGAVEGSWARRSDVQTAGHTFPVTPADSAVEAIDIEALRQEWRSERVVAEGRDTAATQDEGPALALLVGGRAPGEWALVVTEDAVLLPSTPITIDRFGGTGIAQLADEPFDTVPIHADEVDEDEDAPPGRLASARDLRTEPNLPLTLRAPLRTRLLGGLMAAVGLLTPPLLVLLGLAEKDMTTLGIVAAAGSATVAGVHRMTLAIRLDRERFTYRGPFLTHHVPWTLIHGARIDGDEVALAYEPAEVVFVGPFAPGNWPPGVPDRAEVAAQTAALAETLRERALAGHSNAAQPSNSPGPGLAAVPVYAVAAATTLGWHLLG